MKLVENIGLVVLALTVTVVLVSLFSKPVYVDLCRDEPDHVACKRTR